VYENEPSIPRELASLDNVVLLPHIGSATLATRSRMAVIAAGNVIAVLGGEPPLTPVTTRS
jgi:glyoxylate reductase